MPAIIEVCDLVKHYPKVQAVNGVSFAIEPGICFGLLGPNGAGKTTTIEMMEGIQKPTSGSIFYKQQPLGRQFRNEAGIQFQHTALPDFLTVKDALRLFHSLYPRSADLEQLVDLCNLRELLSRDARKLSGGQRQRLLLGIALVNDPSVLFLDEPTTGLDPQARRNFWELIRATKARNKTIILTTHYMEEAYTLCDEIAIMDHGRVIARGTPNALLQQHFKHVFLRLPRADFSVPLENFPFTVFESDGYVEIQALDVNESIALLLKNNVPLTRLEIRPPSLEDLFLELTGKALRM
ncbi:MAG: ABC transporter ATP-binding protein [Gammaproteobacteria bacterium]|nr:ABC transporter ATP-binding protein [Gammaproteobacteria bacterium]